MGYDHVCSHMEPDGRMVCHAQNSATTVTDRDPKYATDMKAASFYTRHNQKIVESWIYT